MGLNRNPLPASWHIMLNKSNRKVILFYLLLFAMSTYSFSNDLSEKSKSYKGNKDLNNAGIINSSSSITSTNTLSRRFATIWLESFQDLADGTTVDNGSTAWTRDASGMQTGYLEVRNQKFVAHGTSIDYVGGVGIWKSQVINIASYTGVTLAVDISGEGSLDTGEDYLRVYYKLNGGAETLFTNGNKSGPFTAATVVTPALTGNTVQIIVRAYNTGDSESYFVDNVKVSGTAACALSVTASSSIVIDCSGDLTTLSTNITGGTYSWSGPGNFSSTAATVSTRVPGIYSVIVTKNGCTGSANVSAVMRPSPGVMATGGSIGCNAASVTLTASSTVAGVTYRWTGPSGFTTTTQQNPTTSIPGTYTVVATDPVTGCTSTSKVNVLPGTASSVWLEDFNDLSNGTTVDNGATAWSRDISATNLANNTGHFEVRSNKFSANFLGGQAIWKSQVINIGSVANASVSFEVAGDGSLNTGGSNIDHFRVYYKLNGGSEILFHDGVYSMSFNPVILSSPILNGSNLQIVIRTSITGFEEYFKIDNIKVTGSTGTLSVTASASDILTCTRTSVNLSTNISGSGNTYSWTGPNSFASTSANPSVTAPGDYTVSVTNSSGCTGTATVNVICDITQPKVTATGGSITCSGSSATLTASSPTSGVTYKWTGPSGFTSTLQNPVVTVAGVYNVVATNPTLGCTSSTSVLVTSGTTSNFWLEDFQDLADGTTVDNGSTAWSRDITATGLGSSSNGYFDVRTKLYAGRNLDGVAIWCTPVLNVASLSSFFISTDLSASGTLESNEDYIKVYYKLNGGAETLLINGSQAGLIDPITVISSALSGSTIQIIIKVFNDQSDEYYYFDNVKISKITGSSLSVTASASDILTCTRTSVILSTNISGSGNTYSWTGPNSFTSSLATPSVTAPGDYTVSVTNSSGCTGTATVTVICDITPPGVTATGGSLTCSSSSVTLTASSPTAGVTYKWTGPGGFNSTQQNPVVSVAGVYTVVATNPTLGCTSTTSVNVTSGTTSTFWLEDFQDLADGTTVDNGVTAWSRDITATGLGSSSNGYFDVRSKLYAGRNLDGIAIWCTPVLSVASLSSFFVSTDLSSSGALESDEDYIKVYYKLNGGAETLLINGTQVGNFNPITTISPALSGSTIQIIVKVFNDQSDEYLYFDNVKITGITNSSLSVTASASGKLTCSATQVTLSTNVPASGSTFSWTGPGGYTSNQANPVVAQPGTYSVTVTNSSGCSGSSSVNVLQDINTPGATASVSGSLNCTTSSVTLTGASSTAGVTFGWTGPGGFTSASASVAVTAAGTYTLIVTNPVNGCTSSASINVLQNGSLPGAIASVSGSLTCTTASVTLSGTSPTSGVTFKWAGPGGFTSSVASPPVSAAGTYTLTVTNPANGCTSTASVNVLQNISLPGATASVSGMLTCAAASVTLTGTSPTVGVTFAWTGPGGFTSAVSNPTVSIAGTYTLVVTNPANGCTSSASVNVQQNGSLPGATATVSGPLTCIATSATLSGTSPTVGVTFAWTGPGGFTSTISSPTVSAAGTYTLVVTNPANGCTSSASVNVLQNGSLPGATASVSGVLTCTTVSVTLSGFSPTSGVTFAWTGPGGFTSTVSNPVVSAAGSYTLVVTNPANGCTSSVTVNVQQNISLPGAIASVSGALSCTSSTATLLGSSPTAGVTYNWTGPGGFTSSVSNPVISVGGSYTLTVTNPVNGCSSTSTIGVPSGGTGPGAVASASSNLNCNILVVTLSGSSPTSGVTYKWTGPDGFTSTVQNPVTVAPGTYTLTVTNPSNGCSSNASVSVLQNIVQPDAAASSSGIITCTNTSASISGTSTTPGVTYRWTGPGGFNSTQQNVTVTLGGGYTLTVTNPVNGCATSTTVNVPQNTLKPGATAFVSGVINCNVSSVTLSVTSPTTGVSYKWTGPAGFNSTLANPTTATPGTYTVTVTDPVNGCSSTDNIDVEQNITPPGAIGFPSNAIDCNNLVVTLSGTSPTSGVTYKWIGPNGFSSTVQNPLTTVAGIYTLTVTYPTNGCKSSTTVNVLQNDSPPGATASVSGTINCKTSSVTLQGSSPTSGVTYQWIGPGGFTSSIANPTTTVAGNYTLTVTNPTTGCISTASVNVQQVTTPPGATASVSGTLTCTTATVTLLGSSATSGVVFSWTGPGSFTSTVANPTTSTAGLYTLTVTSPATGCVSTATVNVIQNNALPGATASVSGTLTCTVTSATLTGSSPTSGVTYSWAGPGGFTATTAVTTTTVPGSYTLTVTNSSNGCVSTSSVNVLQNISTPGATASVSGSLSCTVTSVTLTGASATAGVSFKWTGPGGFSSTLASPTTTVAGSYTLTVTNPANGCISTASINVLQNNAFPGATASVSNVLSCTTTPVTLTGASSTVGVSFSWTGPGGFSANTAVTTTTVPGNYTLTVTNPANGCTSTAIVNVQQNIAVPGALGTVSGILTCSNTTVILQGTSPTSGAIFKWTGPGGLNSTVQNTPTSTPGSYILAVTNPVNGCVSLDTVEVLQNISTPGAIASVTGSLTCTTTSATLTGSSPTAGVTFKWVGPGGFSSTTASTTTSVPGNYILTVTNPVNGCTSTANVNVIQDIAKPVVAASVSGVLTCTTTTVTLSCTSPTPGLTFKWTGPGGFISSLPTPTTSLPGKYTLVVTNSANGCLGSDTINVQQNIIAPGATASVSGILSCTTSSVTLTGTSPTSPVSFKWSGPGGFSATTASTSTTVPGSYTLTVTNPVNGCISTSTVNVIQNLTGPGATASVSGPITCVNATVTLSGSSVTSGVVFSWSGPGGFSSTLANPTTSTPGSYTLTVTSPASGCTSTATVNVIQNNTGPGATASVSGVLTCATTTVTLTGSSPTSGVVYSWSGPGGFTSTVASSAVTIPGTYTVTITNPANGCVSTASVNVLQNITTPGATATVSGPLTCTTTSVTLTGSSSTSGVTFKWTGPGSFTATTANTVATVAGSYTLTVTNPVNGCISTATVNVLQNTTTPGATTSVSNVLSCTISSVTLTGTSPTSGSTFSWTGPGGFSATTAIATTTVPGTYTLTVTNPANGCTSTATANVQQNLTAPGGAGSVSGVLTCSLTTVILQGTSPTAGVTYKWTGPGGLNSTVQNTPTSTPGSYTLVVTNPVNGCVSTAVVEVLQNGTLPGATASASGSLTCTTSSVTLTGTSPTTGVTFKWTGPGGFSATTATTTATVPGNYILTVTNGTNGCTSSANVSVIQNNTKPVVAASVSGVLTCTTPSVTLSGSSTTSGLTFLWTGPAGFTSTLPTPTTSVPGKYTIVVTNSANGCLGSDTVNVDQNITVPGASASVSGTLTCTASSVTLTGTSPSTGVTFKWAGPGGFIATTANTTTTVPGAYTLTVTNALNGCISTATVNVIQNTTGNEAAASVSGPLNCISTTVTLTGTSPASGVSFKWTGPGGFSATTAITTTTVPGSYTLTVTNPANGCISTASVNVIQNITTPGATASVSGALSCATTSVTLTGASTTAGVTFKWTGPGGFNATTSTATATTPGTYTLTVTNPINGCVSIATVDVIQNGTTPGATASVSGPLNCTTTTVNLTGSSTTAGVTFKWTGPGTFSATTASTTTTVPGSYTLTVTNPANGCVSTATISVIQDITAPNATASVSGQLTCTTTSVTLTGASTTTGVTYKWVGPGTFTSTIANPTTTVPGSYTLTVTNPVNGCVSTATANVLQNITVPGATAAVSGPLTCTSTTVTLTGTSSTAGATFKWTGPGGFNVTTATAAASTAGTYTLTVTNPANGCVSTANVDVIQNGATPGAAASVSGPITCTITTVTLTGTSPTAGVTYKWVGPGTFTSTIASPTTTVPGSYTLTVSNPVNGCVSTATVNVIQNITVPGATASVSGPLTCTTTSVTLTGSSTTAGVTYSWTGPGTFSSTVAAPTTTVPGSYTLTVTNPVNGCISTATVSVLQNITVPGATTSVSGQLTCAVTSVTITGASPTAGVTYKWIGPGTFSSTAATATATVPGAYTLTVTNPVNGCISTSTVNVLQNITVPGASSSASGTLTCSVTSVTITGTSPTTGVTYKWTGPGTFSSTTATATATVPGAYTLTVTNPVNGCISTSTVNVLQNITAPGASVSVSGPITCSTTIVTLSATSPTTGVSYNWTGPGGFTSSVPNPTTTVLGDYTVTITNPANGCVSTANVSVLQNNTPPTATATVSGALSCSITSVTLNASSTTSGVTYKWTGPGSFLSNLKSPVVSVPGAYALTITNPANGCTSSASINVLQNIALPDLVATGGEHTCITIGAGGLVITSNSSVAGAQYSWTVPAGYEEFFTDTNVKNLTIPFSFIIGDFTVKVTNPANGCQSFKTVTVTDNSVPPVCFITFRASNNSLTVEQTPGVTYSWSINNPAWGIVSGQGTNLIIVSPGAVGSVALYTVLITNPVNGCSEDCSLELRNTPTGIVATATGSPASAAPSVKQQMKNSQGESLESEPKVSVYPNPFSEKTTIEFVPVRNEHLRLEVYSFIGDKITTLFEGDAESGKIYKASFDASHLAHGIYYYRLSSKKKLHEGKLILAP